MQCCICGKPLEYCGRGVKPKYCSSTCRVKAKRIRDQIGALPAPTKKKKTRPKTKKQEPEDDFEYTGDDIPANRHAFAARMEREMDEPLEVTLRRNRARLQREMDDPGCKGSALAAISKQLVAVSRELEQVTGAGANQFADLLDEESEMSDDPIGAEII